MTVKIGARRALNQLENALKLGGNTVSLSREAAEDCRALLRLVARQDDGEGVVLALKASKHTEVEEDGE